MYLTYNGPQVNYDDGYPYIGGLNDILNSIPQDDSDEGRDVKDEKCDIIRDAI